MKTGLLRGVYTIKGANLDYILNFLHRKGVSVYSFSKTGLNTAKICIDFKHRNKLFAICNNMSYNITKVYYKGLLSPLKTALCYFGFVLGVALFTFICYLSQNFIFSVEVTGSGACFSSQTIAVAYSAGAKPFSKFSSLNFGEVESKILNQNQMLSFVKIKRAGNRLIINTELSSGYLEPLNKESGDIISNYNGVIESIVVLRGTPLKAVGESVTAGETIVKGVITDANGQEYPTFVIARISIIELKEFSFTVSSVDDNSLLLAKKTAEFNADGEVVNSKTQVNQNKITVTVYIRRIIGG